MSSLDYLKIDSEQAESARAVMGMDHVCITVPDVDKSIEFYSKGLGLRLLRVSVLNPVPGTEYKNAYMYSGTFLLELITADSKAISGQAPKNWQNAMRGHIGITHLGMSVKNLDSAIEKLKAAGGKMIGEPFKISKETSNIVYAAEKVDSKIRHARKPGRRVAVFSDPDGIIVELAER